MSHGQANPSFVPTGEALGGAEIEVTSSVSSTALQRQESGCGDLRELRSTPPIVLRSWHRICILLYTLSCYIGMMGMYAILGQYIFHRFALEVGIPDGGMNSNGTPCNVNKSDPDYLLRIEAQEKASQLQLIATFVSGVPSVPSTLIIGAYSDRLGRKISMLIPWAGYVLNCVILVSWVFWELPMWLYIVAGVPSSCLGGFGAMIAGLFAMVSDVTTGRQRSLGIALVEMAMGISGIVSSLLVGWWIQWSGGYNVPLYGMCALLASSAIYVMLLPETSTRALRRAQKKQHKLQSRINETEQSDYEESQSDDKVSVVGSTTALTGGEHDDSHRDPWTMLKISAQVFLVDRNRGILLCLVLGALFLHMWALMGSMAIGTLFLLNQPFCWDSVQLGIYKALQTTFSQAGTFIVIALLRHRVNETWLVIFGFFSYMLSSAASAVAGALPKNACNYVMSGGMFLGMFTHLVPPLSRSIASKLVTEYEQGVMYAAVACLESISVMTGNMISNAIYSATVSIFPGFTFIFTCVVLLFGIALMLFYHWRLRRKPPSDRVSLRPTAN